MGEQTERGCVFCPLVNGITFWPWSPYRKCKRVLMGVLGIALGIPTGITVYMAVLEKPEVLVPVVPLFALSLFCLLLSLLSCDRCVAKSYATGP